MWGERGEGSAGEFVCMGRKMLLPGRSMPYAPVYSGFSYLFWTGSLPYPLGTPDRSWPRELLSSLHNPFVFLSSERHLLFPSHLFCLGLVSPRGFVIDPSLWSLLAYHPLSFSVWLLCVSLLPAPYSHCSVLAEVLLAKRLGGGVGSPTTLQYITH